MKRLSLQTYYNDKPVLVKVLVETQENSLWDSIEGSDFTIELISIKTEDTKESIDIEEAEEDGEFMLDLIDLVVNKLDEDDFIDLDSQEGIIE